MDARNYLVELYKWHEESRESVELAFDTIIQVSGGSLTRAGRVDPAGARRRSANGR